MTTEYKIICVKKDSNGIKDIGYVVEIGKGTYQSWKCSKETAIKFIKQNCTFYVDRSGKKVLVNAVPQNAPLYLRTDGNDIEEDNLGNLPECSFDFLNGCMSPEI